MAVKLRGLSPLRSEKGQATTEYILLMSVIVTFYMLLAKGIGRIGLAQKLMTPITVEFASAYQFGKVPSKNDPTSGAALRPLNNDAFRVFLNPKSN